MYKLFIFDYNKNKGVDLMDNTALVIAIIGALNWGSIGLFGIDLVATLFGGQTAILSRIVYTLVGISGLWCITLLFKEKIPVNEAQTR